MQFKNVSIMSVAYVEAPHIVTSESLEQQLSPLTKKNKIPLNLIQKLTGIRARRFWDEGVQPSEVASQAAVKALNKVNLDRNKIGCLISTSVCKDYIEPSVASLVHGNLKLNQDCLNFDLGNACLAFLNGMEVAGNMIERGQIDYALIVDGEGSRYAVEQTIERLLKDNADSKTIIANFATMTLGSGAVAMVLARKELIENGHDFLGGVSLAATEYNRLCLGQNDGMWTDATTLLKAGVKLANQTYQKAAEVMGWKTKSFDELILHQVGKRHTEILAKLLGLNLNKIYTIYQEFGNIGPASIPFTLAKAEEEGRLSKGDRVALMGIGSGLNCAMMEVIW